jgi:hypothetical protein
MMTKTATIVTVLSDNGTSVLPAAPVHQQQYLVESCR